MNRETFRQNHSEIIMYFQCIEQDLKWIVAARKKGNFNANIYDLEHVNLGETIMEIKEMDEKGLSVGFSDEDYRVLEKIREKRNYWCHQCFLDYVYLADEKERENMYEKIALRLEGDLLRVRSLHLHIQSLRLKLLKEYNRI